MVARCGSNFYDRITTFQLFLRELFQLFHQFAIKSAKTQANPFSLWRDTRGHYNAVSRAVCKLYGADNFLISQLTEWIKI